MRKPKNHRSDQSLGCVQLFATPWIAARQASLSITNSWSSLRLTSIESVMPFSYLILCRPPLLLSPIPPSIRVFSNESTLCMRWPKYWSFSFSIIPSKEILPCIITHYSHQTRVIRANVLQSLGPPAAGQGVLSGQEDRLWVHTPHRTGEPLLSSGLSLPRLQCGPKVDVLGYFKRNQVWIFVRSSYFLKIGIWFKIQKQTKRGWKTQNKTKCCFSGQNQEH